VKPPTLNQETPKKRRKECKASVEKKNHGEKNLLAICAR